MPTVTGPAELVYTATAAPAAPAGAVVQGADPLIYTATGPDPSSYVTGAAPLIYTATPGNVTRVSGGPLIYTATAARPVGYSTFLFDGTKFVAYREVIFVDDPSDVDTPTPPRIEGV